MTFRPRSFHLAFAASLSLAAVACGGADAADDPSAEGDEQDVTGAKSVKLTEADDGKTVTVKTGQQVVLTLPSNPTTGYSWKVTATDRTFGYPKEKFIGPASSAIGAGGSQRFTWKTSGPLPMQGAHTVTLSYARGDGPPAKTFTFTVDIVDELPEPGPSGDAVTADEADDGKVLDVPAGKRVELTLPSNATTGFKWSVVSTNRTFGYPEEEFLPPATDAIGASGAQKFTWRTDGPLPMLGTHTVELHYKRSWETSAPPAKTFRLVVRVQ